MILNNSKSYFKSYKKLLKVIESITTEEHYKCCIRLINNFNKQFKDCHYTNNIDSLALDQIVRNKFKSIQYEKA